MIKLLLYIGLLYGLHYVHAPWWLWLFGVFAPIEFSWGGKRII